MSVITIDLDSSDLKLEISEMMQHRSDYMTYLKEKYKKQKKQGKKNSYGVINIRLGKVSDVDADSVELEDYPLLFWQSETDKRSLFHLDIINPDEKTTFLLRKELSIPKSINIDEEIKNIDILIDKNNLIIRMKNLMDKINYLNNIQNEEGDYLQMNEDKLSLEELDSKLSHYKEIFRNLKNEYDNYVVKRRNLVKLKGHLNNEFDSKINTIQEAQDYYNSVCIDAYNKILPIINSDKEFTKFENAEIYGYFILKQKLDTLLGLSMNDLESKQIVIYNDSDLNSRMLGTIIAEKDADNVIVKPHYQQANIIIPKSDVINNIQLGNYEEERLIYNNFYKKNISGINALLELMEDDIIIPKLTITKNFSGNYKKNIIGDEEVVEVVKLDKVIKEKTIEISNIDLYEKSQNLFNQEKNTIFIINEISSKFPGKAPNERLSHIDQEERTYLELSKKTDWRKKLSDNFIQKIVYNYTDSIVPIIIDGNDFASFQHYFYYANFINRRDVAGRKRDNYTRFAKSMILKNNNLNSVKRIYELEQYIQEHKMTLLSNESTIKNIMLKGYYAKFSQNSDLQEILIKTNEALLVNKIDLHYNANFNLMVIRKMLLNSQEPFEFYPRFQEDKIILSKTIQQLESKEEEARLDYESTLSMQERQNEASIILASVETQQQSKQDEILKKQEEERRKQNLLAKQSELLRKREEELKRKKKAESRASHESEQRQALIDSGLNPDTMSMEEIEEATIQMAVKSDDSIPVEIAKLESVLEDTGLVILGMPPNGDCLYYSITQGLYLSKIPPMNLDIQDDSSFKKIEFLPVDYGSNLEESGKPIFVNATEKIRNMLADKIQVNFANPSPELEPIMVIIQSDYSGDGDALEKYVNDVRYMVNSKTVNKGDWGDNNVLYAASALFNVNFKVYYNDGQILDINVDHSKQIFNIGDTLNMDLEEIPTINIGSLTNKHYLLLTDDRENDIVWERRKYCIVNIGIDEGGIKGKGKEYPMISFISDVDSDERQVVGIYDPENQTFSFGEDEDLWNTLSERMIAYWEYAADSNTQLLDENTNPDVEVKYYWQNTTNNEIINPNIGLEPVGKLVKDDDDDEDTDDEVYYIEFND